MRGLQLACAAKNISAASLPTPSQLSSWLQRAKTKAQVIQSRHSNLVDVVQMDIAAIPRALPDDVLTLFLLDAPVLNAQDACVIFSCRAMLHQLSRYKDEYLCCTVDTKMKVSHHGYGVATFGLLTKNCLRKLSSEDNFFTIVQYTSIWSGSRFRLHQPLSAHCTSYLPPRN